MSDHQPNSNFQEQSNNQQPSRIGQSILDQLVNVNMALFRELGFHVTKQSFKTDAIIQQQQNLQNYYNEQDPSSQLSQDHFNDYDHYQDNSSYPSYPQSSYHGYDEGQIEQYSQISDLYSQIYHNFDQDSWSNVSHNFSNHDEQLLSALHKKQQIQMEFNQLPTITWSQGTRQLQCGQVGEECPICLQEYKQGVSLKMMRCRHSFHQECIRQWILMNDSCPSCRNKIGNNQ